MVLQMIYENAGGQELSPVNRHFSALSRGPVILFYIIPIF